MSSRLLIDAESGPVLASAETSFTKPASNIHLTLSASGLTGSEQVVVEFENVNGSWSPAQTTDGDVVLTVDRSQVLIIGTGRYRVSKGATVSPVTVGVQ